MNLSRSRKRTGKRRISGLATSLLLSAPVVACRFDYETLQFADGASLGGESGGGSTGIPTAGAGGTSSTSAGGASVDAPESAGGSQGTTSGSGGNVATGGTTGSGGTGSVIGDYHVTTSAGDDSTGSLREALNLAIADGGTVSITFEPGLHIIMDDVLPALSSEISLLGNTTHIDFSAVAGSVDCIVADPGSTLVVDNLEISGCGGEPIRLNGGTNHRITNSELHNNASGIRTYNGSSGTVIGPGNIIRDSPRSCVILGAMGDRVIDNRFSDCIDGVLVAGSGDGAEIVGNLMVRAQTGIEFQSGVNDTILRFNTIVRSTQNAMLVHNGSGHTIQNNILTHTTSAGISGSASMTLSNNLYFSNGTVACNNCTPGAGALVGIDPLYVDFDADDYRLQAASQAVDGGTDVGEDRNGGSPGNFNGLAPDMGFQETN